MNSSFSDLECKFSSRNWKMVLIKNLSVVGGKTRGKLGLGLLDNIEPSSIFTVLLSQNPKKRGRLNHLGTNLPFT